MIMMTAIKCGKNMKVQNSFSTTTNPNTLAGRLRSDCVARLLPLLLLLALPAAVQAQYDTMYTGGSVMIVRYNGAGGNVIIPRTIGGLPVTSIGGGAFSGCTNLTSVTIPNSVTRILGTPFSGCTSLTAITMESNDYFSSMDGVLFNRYKTTLIECPGGKAGSYTVPDSVTNIGSYAFSYCTSLTSVTIGTNVISIGSCAFSCCTSLTAITADASNPFYSSVDGVLFDKSQNTLCAYPGGKAGGYTIPSSVTSIEGGAFSGCTSLTNVTIPDSFTSIGDAAFYSCYGLTSVTIPDSVTSIGSSAFYFCTSLTYVMIPDSVTSIGDDAFESCISLTSVMIGNSVTSIGDYAFYYCTSLTSVTIPNSVINIGWYAFQSCTSLTNVTIPDSVTSIGSETFYRCTSLTSVTIPNSVTNIGYDAFFYCTSLTAITLDINNPAYSSVDGVLFDKSQNTLCAYPEGKAGGYTIPDSVTSIGGYAFYYCTSLTNVTIPDSVTNIGDYAFSSCTSLMSVTIPDSVASIGDHAFYYCTNLMSVTIPDSVTSIGGHAFSCCTSLMSVTIPDSVTSIGDWAFWSCSSLTNITIPGSVTSIGDQAFYHCTSLTSVYFRGDAPSLGSSVFDSDNNATVYYLPGTTGWGTTFAGLPTVLWKPQVQTTDASFGVRTNQFGFNINWASGQIVVVEACTDLANPLWSPVGTNTLTSGSSYFSDPDWTNYPSRFYRLRSP